MSEEGKCELKDKTVVPVIFLNHLLMKRCKTISTMKNNVNSGFRIIGNENRF